MKNGFDVDLFASEMEHVFNEYSELNKRSLPELLKKRMLQLAIGSGGGHKGLFQEARDLRPLVQAEIKYLPKRLNHHILRHGLKTEAAAIQSRLSQAGYFQASGWLVEGFTSGVSGPGSQIKTQRGSLDMQLDGDNPHITLTNSSPRALEFGEATGYIARAFYNQTQDMLEYIQKHLDMTAAEFSRSHPNFHQSMENFIPS